MTDDLNSPDLPPEIAALLGDERVWEEVDLGVQDDVLAAIRDERDAQATPVAASDAAPSPSNVVELRPARWKTAALGAAAALLLVAGIFGITQIGSGSGADLELALEATELAPTAAATAEITNTTAGTRIVLRGLDLPPAEPGTYYEAWLRKDANIGVSAGTFHLRGGTQPIELWAGVTPADYPLLTITVQAEAQTESSGMVVLRALVTDNGD